MRNARPKRALATCLALLAGCAPEEPPPEVGLGPARLVAIDFDAVVLAFEVTGPDLVAEPDLALALGDTTVPLVPGADGLEARVDLRALLATGVLPNADDVVPYEVTGTVDVGAGPVAVGAAGELPVPRAPDVTFGGLVITASDGTVADGWLTLVATNPMGGLVVGTRSDGRLALGAGSADVASSLGALPHGLDVAVRIRARVVLAAGASLGDHLSADAHYTSRFDVDTPFGVFPYDLSLQGPVLVTCGGGRSVFADLDGDGFGDPFTAAEHVCAVQGAFVENALDCDDLDGAISPDGVELLYDGIDGDCDVATPDDDYDGDGYGIETDCDDVDPRANPAASERCNLVDDDCDGLVDEGSAAGARTWYADEDADGFGDSAGKVLSCAQPVGTVAAAGDCDDARGDIHPGAAELCDGVDGACDGPGPDEFDDDADGFLSCEDCDDLDPALSPDTIWFADADGDGFGDVSSKACEAPADHVATGGDCDDGDPAVFPTAPEACDGFDQDCDSLVDEGLTDFAANKICASGWWAFDLEGSNGVGSLVTGPGPAPAGGGSARMQLAASADKVRLGTQAYANLPVADLQAVAYDAWRSAGTTSWTVTFQLRIDYLPLDGATPDHGYWVYEAYLGPPAILPPLNTWTHLTPLTGRWWQAGPAPVVRCTAGLPCTWTTLVGWFPDAVIAADPVKAGLSVKAGSGWAGFDGSVDRVAITVGGVTTVHDFEP